MLTCPPQVPFKPTVKNLGDAEISADIQPTVVYCRCSRLQTFLTILQPVAVPDDFPNYSSTWQRPSPQLFPVWQLKSYLPTQHPTATVNSTTDIAVLERQHCTDLRQHSETTSTYFRFINDWINHDIDPIGLYNSYESTSSTDSNYTYVLLLESGRLAVAKILYTAESTSFDRNWLLTPLRCSNWESIACEPFVYDSLNKAWYLNLLHLVISLVRYQSLYSPIIAGSTSSYVFRSCNNSILGGVLQLC